MYKEGLKQNVSKYWNVPSCEISNVQAHTEIGVLPEAGHCLWTVALSLKKSRTRTGRVYLRVNGNPVVSTSGERQIKFVKTGNVCDFSELMYTHTEVITLVVGNVHQMDEYEKSNAK